MSVTLAQLRDLDALKSSRPLHLGLTGRFVSGAPAALRRVLYQWHRLGLLELEGVTLDPVGRTARARQLERVAEDVQPWVTSCSVKLTQDVASGALTIASGVRLVDGRTHPLEVVASLARVELTRLAGERA